MPFHVRAKGLQQYVWMLVLSYHKPAVPLQKHWISGGQIISMSISRLSRFCKIGNCFNKFLTQSASLWFLQLMNIWCGKMWWKRRWTPLLTPDIVLHPLNQIKGFLTSMPLATRNASIAVMRDSASPLASLILPKKTILNVFISPEPTQNCKLFTMCIIWWFIC